MSEKGLTLWQKEKPQSKKKNPKAKRKRLADMAEKRITCRESSLILP